MSEALSLAVIYGALLSLRVPPEKALVFTISAFILPEIEDWGKGFLLAIFLLVLYGQYRKKCDNNESS